MKKTISNTRLKKTYDVTDAVVISEEDYDELVTLQDSEIEVEEE